MDPLLGAVEHRPWPVPSGPWIMEQTWNDLLFAHWPVAVTTLRALVPQQLPLDLYEGRAYVAVAPFWMSRVKARWIPPVPGLARFPELNVRTYVTLGGKPGIYFFSLDAGRRAAVWGARIGYSLPYYYAHMKVEGSQEIRYRSVRQHGPRPAEFRGRYGATGEVRLRERGSLEHFLTERYCLYTVDRGGEPWRAQIHHAQWPLQDAAAEFEVNTMGAAAGIALPGKPPLLHFSKRLRVLIWWPEKIDGRAERLAQDDNAV
jgi:uncharacterized protein YqjF (DUF2071 family)